MTDGEWRACLEEMDELERHVCALPPEAPQPTALRCVHSRHRTLAHLRACQETWVEACHAFDGRADPRLKMLHPWRLFEQRSYELVAWEEHLSAFRADRTRWKALLETADRSRGGKINHREYSIESLTSILVSHERYHLFSPR